MNYFKKFFDLAKARKEKKESYAFKFHSLCEEDSLCFMKFSSPVASCVSGSSMISFWDESEP